MLTELLIGAGRWARRTAGAPWASGIGLARTLLAAGTCGTLLATSPDVLLSPLADGVVPPVCAGVRGAGLWCVVPYLEGQAARALAILILLVVASGWRPRITAVPHWYVSWSLVANVTIQDGGDQITAVLTILLVPVALTDPRRWHWQPPRRDEVGPRHIVANAALALIRLQVAVVYLHASIAKSASKSGPTAPPCTDWFRHGVFGAPDWLRPVTDAMTDGPFGAALPGLGHGRVRVRRSASRSCSVAQPNWPCWWPGCSTTTPSLLAIGLVRASTRRSMPHCCTVSPTARPAGTQRPAPSSPAGRTLDAACDYPPDDRPAYWPRRCAGFRPVHVTGRVSCCEATTVPWEMRLRLLTLRRSGATSSELTADGPRHRDDETAVSASLDYHHGLRGLLRVCGSSGTSQRRRVFMRSICLPKLAGTGDGPVPGGRRALGFGQSKVPEPMTTPVA